MWIEKGKQLLTLMLMMAGLCLIASSAFAQKNAPLPIDQAFVFTATQKDPTHIQLHWKIAPNYYLYTQRIRVNLSEPIAIDMYMPMGKWINGPRHSRYEVYQNQVTMKITLKAPPKGVKLTVGYQGCSRDGFCYPPVTKAQVFGEAVPAVTAETAKAMPLSTLLTDQQGIKTVLATQHIWIILLVFMGLGLLLALTPCVWPMVPILTSIIVGHKKSVTTRKALILSIVYVLGTAITYALAGMAAAMLGQSLQVWLQKPAVILLTGGLFVLLALSLFGLYELHMPKHWHMKLMHVTNRLRHGSYAGVFGMGILSALVVSPCVTAPLVGVLLYISDTGSVWLGASALFMLGIGMGLPLILVGSSAGKWLPKSGPWMEAVKKLFGLLMLALAIWLVSRVLSPVIVTWLWAAWWMGVAAFFGLYLRYLMGLPLMSHGVGIAFLCMGFLLIYSLSPSLSWMPQTTKQTTAPQTFIVVRSVTDLQQELARAQIAHKPVIVDFYADWCESCIAMDKRVFDSPKVKSVLNDYVLLRADLSANNAEDEVLLKQYDVIAPPTVLFFDANGREASANRIVGEVSENEFLTRLDVFMASTCDKNQQVAC